MSFPMSGRHPMKGPDTHKPAEAVLRRESRSNDARLRATDVVVGAPWRANRLWRHTNRMLVGQLDLEDTPSARSFLVDLGVSVLGAKYLASQKNRHPKEGRPSR